MKLIVILSAILLTVAVVSAQTSGSQANNSLTKKEKKQGWQLLFDGHTLNGWKVYNSENLSGDWKVSNGEIVCKAEGGMETEADLITLADFDNFELELEWNISKEGNSGILYHVLESKEFKAPYATGPEYQLIDDAGWPDKLEEWQKTGADYAMYPAAEGKKLMPAGEWNSSRIIYNKGHVEYWLNGMKVVEFQAYSPDWQQRKEQGKWKDYPGYAVSEKGRIALQNHGKGVRFRNVKVRRLM